MIILCFTEFLLKGYDQGITFKCIFTPKRFQHLQIKSILRIPFLSVHFSLELYNPQGSSNSTDEFNIIGVYQSYAKAFIF